MIYDYIIGIDTGVQTGFSVWDVQKKELKQILTVKIHEAMKYVEIFNKDFKIYVRVEDARLRDWFGKHSGPEKLQGAGSVKRDAKIWEDFLTDMGVDFEMVHPKFNKTKLPEETFKRYTGWEFRTSQHGRDAAMLVFKMNIIKKFTITQKLIKNEN